MATATRPSLATKYDNTTATAPDVAKRALFRVTARNRCIVEAGVSSSWEDFKDPECYFSAKKGACGGYVHAEYMQMHDSETGMIGLYAEDADPATDGCVVFIRTNPTLRDYAPGDLAKMAEFLHALGDACEVLDAEVREKLPRLQKEGEDFAILFTRLQDGPRVEHPDE